MELSFFDYYEARLHLTMYQFVLDFACSDANEESGCRNSCIRTASKSVPIFVSIIRATTHPLFRIANVIERIAFIFFNLGTCNVPDAMCSLRLLNKGIARTCFSPFTIIDMISFELAEMYIEEVVLVRHENYTEIVKNLKLYQNNWKLLSEKRPGVKHLRISVPENSAEQQGSRYRDSANDSPKTPSNHGSAPNTPRGGFTTDTDDDC